MTDISNWPELIHVARATLSSIYDKENKPLGPGEEYVLIPLNPYQMGNLVDAIAQAEDTGDWWYEVLNIIVVAMDKWGLKELHSNRGNSYTRDDIFNYRIRK